MLKFGLSSQSSATEVLPEVPESTEDAENEDWSALGDFDTEERDAR